MTESSENINLIEDITGLLYDKGMKALTMDFVASSLGMSKRTLYEIFGSKNEMFKRVIRHAHQIYLKRCEQEFKNSSNVMEGMFRVHILQRDAMARLSAKFFRDMDSMFPEVKKLHKESQAIRDRQFEIVYGKGVKEGVFRDDVNYKILPRILEIQLESLKRMEEVFPPDLDIVDVSDSIIIGFLRSIASQKGMILLDRITREYNIFKK